MLIDQVYIAVTGGAPSGDIRVYRADIEPYIGAAITYVLTRNMRELRREAAALGEFRNTLGLEADFLASYYLCVQDDCVSGFPYVVPPSSIVALDGGAGLDSVSAVRGMRAFRRIINRYVVLGNEQILARQTLFWLDRVDGVQRIYFMNLAPDVKEVVIRAMLNITGLSDDDIMPIPAGLEVEIINMARDFFLAQRQTPADLLNNNKDIAHG